MAPPQITSSRGPTPTAAPPKSGQFPESFLTKYPELNVIHVDRELGPKESNEKALVANLRFAESLGAQVVRLKGRSVADAVAEFVRSKHITQVIFGRAPIHDWRKYLYLSAVHRFLRESPPVDVHIVTQEVEE